MSARFQSIQIRTPEGIVFSLRLASPVSRLLALQIDLAVVTTLQIILGSSLGWLGYLSADYTGAFIVIGNFVITMGYGIFMEWFWRGQTIGKRVLRLQVIDERGLRLHASQIVMRNLLRFVDALPYFYFLGGVACLLSRRGQRLGDFAANTIVVRHVRDAQPDLDQLVAGKFNSFRQFPHLEARLRQAVTPLEAGLATQALVRREQLEPAARIRLFADLAAHFRTLAVFPPESVGELSDEQYVRNVVDTIYRKA